MDHGESPKDDKPHKCGLTSGKHPQFENVIKFFLIGISLPNIVSSILYKNTKLVFDEGVGLLSGIVWHGEAIDYQNLIGNVEIYGGKAY